MLPKTTQATQTEVEGNTTVELSGTMGDGTPLEEAAQTEEQTAAPTTEEVKPEETKEEAETQLSEKQVPPREERRMEKLIDTLKDRTDEASELRKQLESLKTQPVPQEQNANLPPWLKDQVPQGEISLDEYRAQVADTARNIAGAEVAHLQNKFLQYQNYKEDVVEVEGLWDGTFKKGSENYDPTKDRKLTELYKKLSDADPNVRLLDVANDLMSFHQAGQEKGQEEIKTSVIKRDAQAAVTPTPTTGELPGEGPDWDSMTLKEKEKWMKEQGIWDV